jgi:hypothetical protein
VPAVNHWWLEDNIIWHSFFIFAHSCKNVVGQVGQLTITVPSLATVECLPTTSPWQFIHRYWHLKSLKAETVVSIQVTVEFLLGEATLAGKSMSVVLLLTLMVVSPAALIFQRLFISIGVLSSSAYYLCFVCFCAFQHLCQSIPGVTIPPPGICVIDS